MQDHSSEAAALRSALAACQSEPYNAQLRREVFDCVTGFVDAMHRDGVLIEGVISELRQVLRDMPRNGVDEDLTIQHAIVQYYR